MDLEFGNYRLRRAERLLLGPKGPVELSARSFDILAMLLERPDDVIGKTELFDVAWPGLVVEENTLQVHVSALRKALDPGMIMTVHGRGYKYAGPRPLAASPAAPVADEVSPPTKPSIAVLPFANLSGDPHQDFLCDGISQNITDDLARFHDLVVIASDSTFVYRNRNTSIQAMSQDLGARYLLQGTVVTSGNHLRIQARLVDSKSGQQVWSESYDGHPDTIFSLQDSVTRTIASTLATAYGGRLLKAWERRPDRAATRNMQAVDLFQRGMRSLNRFTKEDNETARQLFQEAAQHDPNYAKPLAKVAWTHIIDCHFGWSSNPETSLHASLELARKAVSTDPDESWSYWALSGYYQHEGDFERAIAGYEKALELNPNDADVVTDYGLCLSFAGRAEEGLAMAQMAMRLNPHHPDWYIFQFAQLQFNAKKYRDAVNTTKRLREVDTASAQLYLAASYAALGEVKNASMAVTRALELDPQASIKRYTSRDMAQYQVAADLDHFRDCLRKAGLPETSNSSLARTDEKPSIAVLPFDNMSGDPEQDYFSDGITEDIIAELGKFREFLVIARNSSFQFRGKANDVAEVAKKLGVQYVVEGSVRKIGNRVRVAVQLIDAASTAHIWGEHYDRELDDIFAIQDEITQMVAARLARQARTAIASRARARPTDNMSAYDFYLRALQLAAVYDTVLEAEPFLRQAVKLDPRFAAAHAMLSFVESIKFYWVYYNPDHLHAGLEMAKTALRLDPDEAYGHLATGFALLYLRRFKQAEISLDRAVALNPNDPFILSIHALLLNYTARPDEALVEIDEAQRRDPFAMGWYQDFRGIILTTAGRYREATACYAKIATVQSWSLVHLTVCHFELGEISQAQDTLAKLKANWPGLLIDEIIDTEADLFEDPAVNSRYRTILQRVDKEE